MAKNGKKKSAALALLPVPCLFRKRVELLAELEMAASVPAGRRAATPLYGPAVGQRFSQAQLDAAFTLLLSRGAGLSDDEIAKYSVHSFRIFLACALLAANCPRWLIKRMLRWRSDASLEIYARVSDAEWSGREGSPTAVFAPPGGFDAKGSVSGAPRVA